MSRPVANASPDMSQTIALFEKLHDGQRVKDFEHYVFESVAEAIYGANYWTWRRTQELRDE